MATAKMRPALMHAMLIACLTLSRLAGAASGPMPTAADIDQAMHARWDKPATLTTPKSVLTINSLKIGSTNTANEQDVIDGIPPGTGVTAALIDFTVRSYYNDSIQVVRRTREGNVYRDKFGVWDVQTGSPRGLDSTTSEALPN